MELLIGLLYVFFLIDIIAMCSFGVYLVIYMVEKIKEIIEDIFE